MRGLKQLSQRRVGFVENDSKSAGYTELGCHIDSRRIPFAAFLDQQRRAAVASCSGAIMPHSPPPGRVIGASDNAAFGIRHQNQPIILLVAAEHNSAPDLGWFIQHRQDPVRQAELAFEEISAQSLPIVSPRRVGS
jgi:hypothetical protein